MKENKSNTSNGLNANETGRRSKDVPRIKISGLTKRYGQKIAVKEVDLVVEPGQFVVLLGPSGSGKSTLLRCLAGIERPTTGTIHFDELNVNGPGCHLPPERRNLAMVFQDYALWPHLNAEQNVAFALERNGISSNQRKLKARAMLEQVGLGALSKSYPSQLSGGEQQRVGLARALVADPGVLLFDEPLSNLDADRREKLRVDIGAMVRHHGASAVYITHDQAEAFALADVIGVLNSGQLVQVGTPEEIYQSPADAFVARFTGLAGELSGSVVALQSGQNNDLVTVEVNGSLLFCNPIGKRVLSAGEKVQVLVRPSAVRFVEMGNDVSGREYSHDGFSPGYFSKIEVTVLDAAFRGRGYEHVISLCGKFLLSGVPADRRIPFMSQAFVELAPEGCLVIADTVNDDVDPASDSLEAEEYDRLETLQYLALGSEF